MRRRFFLGAGVAAAVAPAIIRTPGLLMPIRPVQLTSALENALQETARYVQTLLVSADQIVAGTIWADQIVAGSILSQKIGPTTPAAAIWAYDPVEDVYRRRRLPT